MKILITGSSGFIGSYLKLHLESKGIDVISYDIKENLLDDINSISNLRSRIVNIDGIIHLAAVSRVKTAYEDPLNCIYTNVYGTSNILEAARFQEIVNKKSCWIIFGSSREVYGNNEKEIMITEESKRNPLNIYGISKCMGEDLCRMYASNYGIKSRVLRFSNVYTGPNDHLDRVIPNFILKSLDNKDLTIHGTGESLIDFIYIKDLIDGIYYSIQEINKSNRLFDDFNLISGRSISLSRLAEIIIEKIGNRNRIKYGPSNLYEVSRFFGDNTKSRRLLKFKPTVTLNEGIDLIIEQFKKKRF